MKIIKDYNDFITEGLFKKDDNLRRELEKLTNSDENMNRLNNYVNGLKKLNKLQIINKLLKTGYSKYLIDSKELDKELNNLVSDGDVKGLINLLKEDEIKSQIVISKQGQLHKHLQDKEIAKLI